MNGEMLQNKSINERALGQRSVLAVARIVILVLAPLFLLLLWSVPLLKVNVSSPFSNGVCTIAYQAYAQGSDARQISKHEFQFLT